MKRSRLAWRMLRRDWVAGELWVLLLAVVIGVASMTAVAAFTDRLRLLLTNESGELLAADLLIKSNRSIHPAWLHEAEQRGLQQARFIELRSVIMAHDEAQLVEAKAVDEHYPLRGSLRISDQSDGAVRVVRHGPAAGTAWPDSMLAYRLKLNIGDAVQLGERTLRVAAILHYEPDRAGDMFTIAPRMMLNLNDLASTGLLGAASLNKEYLLLAGDAATIKPFQQWITPQLSQSETLLTACDSRPELNHAMQRAEQFLGLAAWMAALLSGVAIAMAARRFSKRHRDDVAVMRCLGARAYDTTIIFALELIVLGLIASAIGCLMGYAAQSVLVQLLHGMVNQALPLPGYRAGIFGFAVGIILLCGFALPPIAALRHVPPLRVLRRQLHGDAGSRSATLTAILAVLLLCLWQSGDAKLAALVSAGVGGTLLLLAGSAWLVLRLLKRLPVRRSLVWRYGVMNLTRHTTESIIQIVAFGLGIMAMLLLTVVRYDLLDHWQHELPADAPNTFVVNIQPSQRAAVSEFLYAAGIRDIALNPMIKGRLVAINGHPVSADDYPEERAKHLVRREFNLSWSRTLPPGNVIVQGQWQHERADAPPQWSVEQSLAERLGIHHGDRLRFDVAGQPFEAEVSSIRKVAWDSFRVNFFVLAPAAFLPDEQASYITAFHRPADQPQWGQQLLQEFPTLTMIDVDELMQRLRHVIAEIAQAVQFVFLFTVIAGVVVLFAAIQSSQDERMQEVAVLRTLGANTVTIRYALWAEFAGMGGLAGLLAGIAATAIAQVLSVRVFHVSAIMTWDAIALGAVLGVVLASSAGWLRVRSIINTAPLLVLRNCS